MSTVKATNFSHPSAANPAIVLDAAGGATVAGMGLVLVSPTSIANSGGSASASGGAVTFTGVSSVSLNGVFTSAYSQYRILLTVTGSDAGTSRELAMKLRVSGTDSSADYIHQSLNASSTSVTAARLTAVSSFEIALIRNAKVNRQIEVVDPATAVVTNISVFGDEFTSDAFLTLRSGRHSAATAYDGLSLIPSAGNITGTVRVYGYKNS